MAKAMEGKSLSQKKRAMGRADVTYHIVAVACFVLIGLLCAYPFYYLMICTVSDSQAIALGQITFLPKGLNLDNYLQVMKIQNLGNALKNSILRTGLGTALSLLVTAYMAYFFTKTEMWGRKFWYRMVVATMYFSAGMIPAYLNNKMLGLVNTFWIYIIPGMLSVYNMILVKTSIEGLPPDLEESAYLDGAGYFTRFIRIVLPLQKPILATVGLFSAVHHWNDFFTTKLYVTKPALYTLQFQLYELLNQITAAAEQMADEKDIIVTPAGIRLTLTAVVTIPIMLVYPFIQKYYVKGIMVGAVKG